MRVRAIIIFLFILFLVSSSLGVVLYEYNQDLRNQLEKRDELLNDARVRDSLYALQTKNYSDTITKYVSDCQFEMNGKPISTSELLRMFNNTVNENYILKDSIITEKQRSASVSKYFDLTKKLAEDCIKERNDLRDSTHIYGKMLDIIKSRYGIEVKVEQRGAGSYYFYNGDFSKADSGLLLLPFYRSKLRKNPNSDEWTIITN